MGSIVTGSVASGVDHVIVAARDLEAARRDWGRLGFSVTPRGRHIGWGTANYCVMFPQDYIEILGVVDPALYVHGLDRFLAKREGLQGAAFATDDAASAAKALQRAGFADDQQPRDLARILELPEGEARPAFKLVHPSDPTVFGMPVSLPAPHPGPDPAPGVADPCQWRPSHSRFGGRGRSAGPFGRYL